jgi:leader peptidase (prepilin peptidase)/N-methyltransferase
VAVLLAGFAGGVVGAVIALHLDRFLPRASERHLPGPCESHRCAGLRWTGVLDPATTPRRCSNGRHLLARRWYLPLLGMVMAAATVRLAAGPRHAALVTVFSVLLLALTAADLEWQLLPNTLMFPALVLAVAASGLWPGRPALDSLLGGLVGLAVMLALFVALPGFGFGDVKLAVLLGLVSGAAHVVSALLIGVLAGGLGALMLLIVRRAGRRSTMAYGPYLALGRSWGCYPDSSEARNVRVGAGAPAFGAAPVTGTRDQSRSALRDGVALVPRRSEDVRPTSDANAPVTHCRLLIRERRLNTSVLHQAGQMKPYGQVEQRSTEGLEGNWPDSMLAINCTIFAVRLPTTRATDAVGSSRSCSGLYIRISYRTAPWCCACAAVNSAGHRRLQRKPRPLAACFAGAPIASSLCGGQ